MSKSRKNQIARLDKLWSAAVLDRDNHTCQHCGLPGEHPHHVFLRGKFGTRWLLSNGITLCSEHHVPWAHAKPEAFLSWWRYFVGEETYLMVLNASMQIKIDLDEAERVLKSIDKAINMI